MKCCWNLDHNERPGFAQIIDRVRQLLKPHEVGSVYYTSTELYTVSVFIHLTLSSMQPLRIDLVSNSPNSSVQTATTLDCNSPFYWTPTTPKEMQSSHGSLKRPHPCSIPGQPAYKRVTQRPSVASPSSNDQPLYASYDDEEFRHQLALQDSYVETDV